MVRAAIRMNEEIKSVSFPRDCPHAFEEKVLSVVCGNSHMHWAIHNGKNDGFAPQLFWRTPPLHDDERSDDPCAVLSRHLPKQAHALVFGNEDAMSSKKNASETAAARRVPALTIYVVSTNRDHESALQFLFHDVTNRMFRIEATDFFTQDQGCYEGMGVDRAAALWAAKDLFGAPTLVLDGGTAWTYSALDNNGNILGGGISPGIAARFRSMSDYCGELPNIEYNTYLTAMKAAKRDKKPLPTFAKDTKNAMLSAVFSEIGGQCRNIVKQFLISVKDEAGSKPTEQAGGEAASAKKPYVVIAGGDSAFLEDMLKTDQGGVISCEPDTSVPADQFTVKHMKHIVHYGVGSLLKKKVSEIKTDSPDENLREMILGQRVAKYFDVADQDSENLYRGSVVDIKTEVKIEDDLFLIRYDDGDTEHFDMQELYFALKLYHKEGEKSKLSNEKPQFTQKKEQAKTAAESMLDKNEKLREGVKEAEVARAAAKEKGLDPDKMSKKRQQTAPTKAGPSAKKPRTSTGTPGRKKKDKKTMYLNKRVAKGFDQDDGKGNIVEEIFYGTIDRLSNTAEPFLWHVQYDDDDEEDYDERDVKRGLKMYAKHEANDPNKKQAPEASNETKGAEPVPMDVEPSSAAGETSGSADAVTAAAEPSKEQPAKQVAPAPTPAPTPAPAPTPTETLAAPAPAQPAAPVAAPPAPAAPAQATTPKEAPSAPPAPGTGSA